MLGVGSSVTIPIIPCLLTFVVSVMKHKGKNIRKEKVISKESEEVGLKWTKKSSKIVSDNTYL